MGSFKLNPWITLMSVVTCLLILLNSKKPPESPSKDGLFKWEIELADSLKSLSRWVLILSTAYVELRKHTIITDIIWMLITFLLINQIKLHPVIVITLLITNLLIIVEATCLACLRIIIQNQYSTVLLIIIIATKASKDQITKFWNIFYFKILDKTIACYGNHDIFISYQGYWFKTLIMRKICKDNNKFFNIEKVNSGDLNVIYSAIKKSKLVMVFIDRDYFKRKWPKNEFYYSIATNKRTFLYSIDGTIPAECSTKNIMMNREDDTVRFIFTSIELMCENIN